MLIWSVIHSFFISSGQTAVERKWFSVSADIGEGGGTFDEVLRVSAQETTTFHHISFYSFLWTKFPLTKDGQTSTGYIVRNQLLHIFINFNLLSF